MNGARQITANVSKEKEKVSHFTYLCQALDSHQQAIERNSEPVSEREKAFHTESFTFHMLSLASVEVKIFISSDKNEFCPLLCCGLLSLRGNSSCSILSSGLNNFPIR